MKLLATCFSIFIVISHPLAATASADKWSGAYRHALAGAEIRKPQCYDLGNPGSAIRPKPAITLAIDMDSLEASGRGGGLQIFADDMGDKWKLRLQAYNEGTKQWEDATGVGVLYELTCRWPQ